MQTRARDVSLGGALRRAWVGYQRRLDDELAAAGFDERRFPDGRVLRICAKSAEATISQIGRELGITRQGASKIVASLRDRRYVTLEPSAQDGREKIVTLTPRALDYLAAHRKATRKIERQLRTAIGPESFDSLHLLLQALGGDEQPRMSDYLRKATDLDSLR
jgi:DNA-binding MarR family transcriptional regulator